MRNYISPTTQFTAIEACQLVCVSPARLGVGNGSLTPNTIGD